MLVSAITSLVGARLIDVEPATRYADKAGSLWYDRGQGRLSWTKEGPRRKVRKEGKSGKGTLGQRCRKADYLGTGEAPGERTAPAQWLRRDLLRPGCRWQRCPIKI